MNISTKILLLITGAATAGLLYLKITEYHKAVIGEVIDSKRVQEAVVAVQPPLHHAYEVVNVAVVEQRGLTEAETKQVWELLVEAKLKLATACVEAAIMSKDLFEKGVAYVSQGRYSYYSMGTAKYEELRPQHPTNPKVYLISSLLKGKGYSTGINGAKMLHAEYVLTIEKFRGEFNALKNTQKPSQSLKTAEEAKSLYKKVLNEAAPMVTKI